MDLLTLLTQLRERFAALANNPLAQFGVRPRLYLGTTLLPERLVPENIYEESGIRWRTVIANEGTRYSPAVKKSNGMLMGTMLVQLAEADIAAELTAREYDALLNMLRSNQTMEAMATVLRWVDTQLVRPFADLNEKQRWQALVNAQITRKGDNSYREVVNYPNPSGHRVTVSDAWDTGSGDPLQDMYDITQVLREKGYIVNRAITRRNVVTAMLTNTNVRERAGAARLQIDSTAQLTAAYGRPTLQQLNAVLAEDELPPIEIYDQQYQDYDGFHHFIPDGTMVFAATTGQDVEIIEDEENIRILPDTLGYTAIGRATGEVNPGRVIRTWAKDDRPPRLYGEGWQTYLPVITNPEAVAVLKGLLT
jgi:hypothetical protein